MLQSEECSRCGDLDESSLKMLLESHEEELEANKAIGKIFFFVSMLVAIPLILSFIV